MKFGGLINSYGFNMNSKEKRLEELRAKKTLTNEEMGELVRLSPKDSFKLLPNAYKIGIKNLEKSNTNALEANAKMKEALEKEFYLEVISLGLQKIDFWLRMFWVVKNNKGEVFSADDKRTFGMILFDCKKIGLDEDLFVELKEFNYSRINGIHKYLLGEVDYKSLKKVSENVGEIIKKVSRYVGNQIGVPLN